MAIRLSTGMRNAVLTGSTGMRGILDGGFLDIYSGSQPANADNVELGSKLVRISSTCGTSASDGLRFGTGSTAGLMIIASPAWQGNVILGGVAAWARFYGTAGTAGSSPTEKRIDMSVGVAGADLNLSHTNLALDSVLTITQFNVTEPAE